MPFLGTGGLVSVTPHITPQGLRQGRPLLLVVVGDDHYSAVHLSTRLYPILVVKNHWECCLLTFSSMLLVSEVFCFSINSSELDATHISSKAVHSRGFQHSCQSATLRRKAPGKGTTCPSSTIFHPTFPPQSAHLTSEPTTKTLPGPRSSNISICTLKISPNKSQHIFSTSNSKDNV